MTEKNHSTPAENPVNASASNAWSNPAPAGLVSLAVASFCFFALLNGFVETSAMPLIGCWLLGCFLVQLIVGIVDLKNRNQTGGNTFLFFSAFFLLAGGIEMFIKHNAIVSGTPLDTTIDGYAWIVLTLAVYLWLPAFLKPFSLLSLVVIVLAVAMPFITLIDLGVLSSSFSPIPAYALLIAGLIALYLSASIVVNTAYGRNVYPIIEPKKK
ncbi:MAG: hypothetical protein FWC40_03115 [Proteobacteria bacterium]|nr:hypothetical protein [Pseudomonadota bacterium]MCL2325481.1 hypothetical protein [Pseudomonadota bacterium]